MSNKTHLTNQELDILDGINRPSLDSQITKELVNGNIPNEDSLARKAAPSTEQLIEGLKSLLKEHTTFDAVTNTKTTKGGTLSRIGALPDSNEIDAIIDYAKEKIDLVKTKAATLKSAVITRQKHAPTEIIFVAKEKNLLKKGMVRVFSHKADTITFDHYMAALEARDQLAKDSFKEQTLDLEKVLKHD